MCVLCSISVCTYLYSLSPPPAQLFNYTGPTSGPNKSRANTPVHNPKWEATTPTESAIPASVLEAVRNKDFLEASSTAYGMSRVQKWLLRALKAIQDSYSEEAGRCQDRLNTRKTTALTLIISLPSKGKPCPQLYRKFNGESNRWNYKIDEGTLNMVITIMLSKSGLKSERTGKSLKASGFRATWWYWMKRLFIFQRALLTKAVENAGSKIISDMIASKEAYVEER